MSVFYSVHHTFHIVLDIETTMTILTIDLDLLKTKPFISNESNHFLPVIQHESTILESSQIHLFISYDQLPYFEHICEQFSY